MLKLSRIFLFLLLIIPLFSQKYPRSCLNPGFGTEAGVSPLLNKSYSPSLSVGAKGFVYYFPCGKAVGLWATTGLRFHTWKTKEFPASVRTTLWELLLALQYRRRKMCLPSQCSYFAGLQFSTYLRNKNDLQISNPAFLLSPSLGIIYKFRHRFFYSLTIAYDFPEPLEEARVLFARNIYSLKANNFSISLFIGYSLY